MLTTEVLRRFHRRDSLTTGNRFRLHFVLWLLRLKAVVVAALLAQTGALAQITADPSPGLGTTTSGACAGGGACSITGGTAAGPNNLFHSFSSFDTRSWRSGSVLFQNGSFNSVFVAVNDRNGTWITVPVSLENPASLYWLSPGGISISGSGSFSNVLNLQLSTATSLRFPAGGVFDANATAEQAAQLRGNPQGFFTDDNVLGNRFDLSANGDIVISSGLLVVDPNLLPETVLLDSQAGSISLFGDLSTDGADFWARTNNNTEDAFFLAGLLNSEGGDISILADGNISLFSSFSDVASGGLESGGGRITLQSLSGSISTVDSCTIECSSADGFLNAGLGEVLLSSFAGQEVSISSAGKIASESLQGSINIWFDSETPLLIGSVENPDFFGSPISVSGLNALQGDFNVRADGDVVLADAIALVGNDSSSISANFGESAIQILPGALVTTQTDGQIVLQGLFDNGGSLIVDRGQLDLDGLAHQNTGSIEVSQGAELRFAYCPDGCEGSTLTLLAGSRLSGTGTVSGSFDGSTTGALTQQAGSSISPGSGDGVGTIGTLTFSNLVWTVQNAALLEFDLGSDSGVSDQINLLATSSAVFPGAGLSPEVVVRLADPLLPPPDGSVFTLINVTPEGTDFTALNGNAVLQDSILGSFRQGSIQFAFAGLETPSPEPPGPGAAPDPGPAPGPSPTPGPGAGPTSPLPEQDPDLVLDGQLDQPILPPWSSQPAQASEGPVSNLPGQAELFDNLQFSDLALLFPAAAGDPDQPLVINVETLPADPALVSMQRAEADRVQDVKTALPDVEQPDCAPQQLSTAELQARLREGQRAIQARAGGRFQAYQPAILSLAFTEERAASSGAVTANRAFLDLTLITAQGEPVYRRVHLSLDRFRAQLRNFYQQIARLDAIDPTDPQAPVRQLHAALIAPIEPELRAQGITSILIATDRGLQAVPFAALQDGGSSFGDRYAFSITPSLRFTCLNPPKRESGRLLAAGASSFQGLAPLPLVPQEIDGLVAQRPADAFLNQRFTPRVLLEQAADARYDRVHVATHAEFLPGGPQQARVHTGAGPVSLAEFARMRDQREGDPLELFSLSACRTAVGDSETELGFAGLALQAGSRSAIGTLWYVDDVATSAVFLQLYRYLDQGYPKAEALQATRQDLIAGRIRLEGNRVLAADGTPLLVNLTTAERQRIRAGLSHPFFWAGITLLGTPW